MSWNFGQENPVGTVTFKSNGPGPNFRFFDSDVNLVGASNLNIQGSGAITPGTGGFTPLVATSFTAPAVWGSTGGTSTGWLNFNSTLTNGQTTDGKGVQSTLTFDNGLLSDYAGNVTAWDSTVNTGTSAVNFTGKLRGGMAHYNIQTSGGTISQFEGFAAVVGTSTNAVGTASDGYCISGEYLSGGTSGYVVTTADGVRGTGQINTSDSITQFNAVAGTIQDTVGQTGVFTTSSHGVQGRFIHNAVTTWPEAWAGNFLAQNSGAGAIMTLGGAIKARVRGNTTGAWTNAYVLYAQAPVNSTGLITTIRAIRVDNQGGANTTTAVGMFINDQSGASTGNTNLALGAQATPSGTWSLFNSSTSNNCQVGPTILGASTVPTTGVQLTITSPVAASGTPVLTRFTGVAHTGMTIAEALSVDFSLAQTLTFGAAGSQIGTQRVVRISPPTYTAASGTQDFGTLATLDITNAPNTIASLTTVGNVYCLMVGITGANLANKAATVYSAIAAPAATITLLNTTQVTSTVGASMAQLGQLTVAQSGGAVTVDQVATLDIVGPPIAGSSVTLTSIWSMLVRSGSAKFGGAIIQGHATAAINSTNTATAAQAATGYITSTSAAATSITLPTGTALGAALNAVQGTIHDLYIDNTGGANLVTIVIPGASGVTASALATAFATEAGLLTVPSGATGQACFRLMFSNATNYTYTRVA